VKNSFYDVTCDLTFADTTLTEVTLPGAYQQ